MEANRTLKFKGFYIVEERIKSPYVGGINMKELWQKRQRETRRKEKRGPQCLKPQRGPGKLKLD